jgi:hypothetical protein
MKRSNELSATLVLASIDEWSIWVGRVAPSRADGRLFHILKESNRRATERRALPTLNAKIRLLAKCLEACLESALMGTPWLQLSAMSDRRAVVT